MVKARSSELHADTSSHDARAIEVSTLEEGVRRSGDLPCTTSTSLPATSISMPVTGFKQDACLREETKGEKGRWEGIFDISLSIGCYKSNSSKAST